MKPYYADDDVTLYHGDCRDVLPSIPDASVDAVCTDPPYELQFMGRVWDSMGIAYDVDLWRECLRVLKPGGHLLAFGGTRTVHRMTCAIEDAGFEIRDGIDWLYGSGFPKSLDVSKAIDKAAGAERLVIGEGDRFGRGAMGNRSRVEHGYRPTEINPDGGFAAITAPATDDARRWEGWGTALKPAREPIVVARKPVAGTVAANVLAYGTGALNINATRVAMTEQDRTFILKTARPNSAGQAHTGDVMNRPAAPTVNVHDAGRWPTNVVLSHAATPDGVDLCADGCIPGCPVVELDRQSGDRPPGGRPAQRGGFGSVYGARGVGTADGERINFADPGGASRFFPVFRYEAKAPTSERPKVDGTAHATVKPLDLMRWLVRLVTPLGGLVLDPFAGSGTTAEACVVEGFRCVTVEREAEYLPLIVARISKPLQPVLEVG